MVAPPLPDVRTCPRGVSSACLGSPDALAAQYSPLQLSFTAHVGTVSIGLGSCLPCTRPACSRQHGDCYEYSCPHPSARRSPPPTCAGHP
eukprot:8198409-Lingulodinium_polyedra.AAC.1